MTIKFKSFSSGSCGNCYYLGMEENGVIVAGILIDAGVSLRRLKKELVADGLDFDSFSDILVTHDHLDHIRSLGSYCKRLEKPVWTTDTLHYALSHHSFTLDHIGAVKKIMAPDEWNEVVPGYIKARYFVVPHDATQTVGYAILLGDYRFVIMTDVGAMTREAMQFASKADTVVIESNYDIDMLMHGSYTAELKARIMSGHGHLSNDICAQSLKDFWHPSLRHVFLCHLSENNNTPQLAYDASARALGELGFAPSYEHSAMFVRGDKSLTLRTLPRRTPSVMFVL